jgi:acetylornithine deacetylase/succinyl-diaminopimelate desuccinylase-like protein
LFIEIPATKPDAPTVFMYGHLDKQPPMAGWEEGTGPYDPVIKGDKLYGRGTVDDGYSVYAGLMSIKALQKLGLPHDRIIFLMEGEEESSSPNLMQYIEKLRGRIGDPALIVCLDAGAGNYETLWVDDSLRGCSVIVLSVSLMKSGMHSGEGSGVVASSFRVLRQLLDRIEDSRTGDLKLPELHMPLSPDIYRKAVNSLNALGEENYRANFSKHDDVEFASKDTLELFLNNMFRATVSVTGVAGLPDIANAGNVLRTSTSVVLSVRIPPALDARKCGEALVKELTRDAPYNAHITANLIKAGTGFMAPPLAPKLEEAIRGASNEVFGKDF